MAAPNIGGRESRRVTVIRLLPSFEGSSGAALTNIGGGIGRITVIRPMVSREALAPRLLTYKAWQNRERSRFLVAEDALRLDTKPPPPPAAALYAGLRSLSGLGVRLGPVCLVSRRF